MNTTIPIAGRFTVAQWCDVLKCEPEQLKQSSEQTGFPTIEAGTIDAARFWTEF